MIKNKDAAIRAIESIEFSLLITKLMVPFPKGQGLTLEEANYATKWYKRFLTLCVKYPDAVLVPNYYIDSMWHQHILDTQQYAKDCEMIFGEFLHHYPYFGMDDVDAWMKAYEQTNQLYRIEFGEDSTSDALVGEIVAAQSCTTACRN